MYPHQERYRNISDQGWQQDSSHECSACTKVGDEFTLSVSTSDKGYDVYFIRDKVYVKHPNRSKKAKNGVRSHMLYKLQLESLMALIGSIDDRDLN